MQWLTYHPGLAEADEISGRVYDLDPAFPLMRIVLAGDSKDKEWAHKLRQMDVERLPSSCDYTDDLDPFEVCVLAARLCQAQADLESAREAIGKALALAPANIEAQRLHGSILEDLGLFVEAFAVCRKTVETLGDQATTSDLITAGHLAMMTDRSEEGAALWKQVAARSGEKK
jgi:tetratricopeptide (TPR) repeat protein